MDSRDLRNLSEAWDNITSSEFEVLDEQGNRRGQGSTSGAAQSQDLQQLGQRFKSFADRGGIAGAINRRLQAASAQNGNPNRRGQGSTSGVTRPTPTVTPAAPVRPAPAAPVRPAPAAPAKPAPTATAKPAPTATAKPAPTATSTAAPAAAAPARRSLAQDLADLRAMRAASQMRQQGKKLNGKIPTGADVQAASQSVSDLNKGARQYMQQDVDMFDIVKGHLMSEGYADSEESAIAIMANMSEEWRQSILEVVTTTGATAPKAVPSQAFPGRPYMGLNRPYQEPFINPSGERAPVDRSLFKGASKPVKKDTKTA
jgi:hypothetical protein